jgi:diketogulonate reductase-like aldo/keto reductase
MNAVANNKVTLHNGIDIPLLGYRVDRDHRESIYDNMKQAIQAGFRHFDLPCDAESEKIAGRAIRDSGIPRYEFFLTMKLGNDDHGYNASLRALNGSLKRVGTEYTDLYLINWPNPVRFRSDYETSSAETWKALETAYKNGKARAIGLANSEAVHIEHFLEIAEISPMVNQIRMYPGFPSFTNFRCANDHAIQTEGFLPPDHDAILSSRELNIFAEKYHVTPRQICIRYLLQKKCIALCQGSILSELQELDKVFDFRISDEDMKYMDVMKNYGLDYIDPDTCDF